MRRIFFLIIFSIVLALACQKDSFITSADADIITTDSVYFDTVFTSTGSVTRSFTIVNNNDQKLRVSSLRLAGGSTSAYVINANGSPGTSFSNLDIGPRDSMYVFVKVTINPTSSLTPFLVKDSIEIAFNGKVEKVQLRAFGQNARFITQSKISTNTTWNNLLPYVVVNPLTIDPGVTLTLQEGTRVYCNASAPIVVNGSMQALGNKYDSTRVVFRGDRLDPEYKDLPGAWPGIIFNNGAGSSLLQYTSILNAYQALIAVGGATQNPARLTLNQCIVDNAYDIGLYAFNTSIVARNCLISQCGNDGNPGTGGSNIIIAAGGNYNFSHCTAVTYANQYQNHKQGVLFLSNTDGTQAAPLNATFTNCIFFGQGGLAEDEIKTSANTSAAFSVAMRNVLYKVKNDPAGITFSGSIKNQDPQFDTVNTSLRIFNFRLRDSSPCVNTGLATPVNTDLDGNPRPVGILPDLGCYERQ
jgi:hypothetical protein